MGRVMYHISVFEHVFVSVSEHSCAVTCPEAQVWHFFPPFTHCFYSLISVQVRHYQLG